MSVSAVSSSVTTGLYDDLVKDSSVLDQSDFLELLIAQLTHQDPLEPMSNEQMVSQMTDFGALEELSSMNATLSSMATMQNLVNGSSMIGKAVYGIIADTGQEVLGVVDGIIMEDGEPLVHVIMPDDSEAFLAFDEVLSVANAEVYEEVTGETDTDTETETETETETGEETETTE